MWDYNVDIFSFGREPQTGVQTTMLSLYGILYIVDACAAFVVCSTLMIIMARNFLTKIRWLSTGCGGFTRREVFSFFYKVDIKPIISERYSLIYSTLTRQCSIAATARAREKRIPHDQLSSAAFNPFADRCHFFKNDFIS